MAEEPKKSVDASADLSYAEQRMQTLKVTDENNFIELFNPEAEFPAPSTVNAKIFTAKSSGDLELLYWNIEGEMLPYHRENKSKNGQTKTDYYKRTRKANPKNPDMKYMVPKGQPAWPWAPPTLVDKYRRGEKIDVLYLTEGPFKAWYAALHGIDIIGLASITTYKDKETGKLYDMITKVIDRCQVDRVVILWDADCRDISQKDLVLQEELTRRPKGFFNAVRNIQTLLKKHIFEQELPREVPLRIHFMHPKRGVFTDDPKGLDDMLIVAEEDREKGKLTAVLADLQQPSRKGPFFFRMDVSVNCDRLLRYFNLEKKNVEAFYRYHSQQIGPDNQFYFFKSLYQYIEANQQEGRDEGTVELVTPSWAQDLFWVGDEFFEQAATPTDQQGITRMKLHKRTKTTLCNVYHKCFDRYIPYYTSFVNIPAHFDYERVHRDAKNRKFLNRYFPFEHEARPGEYGTISMFIKHIFGEEPVVHPISGKKIPRYELGLDYVQNLLLRPKQKLPVLILYSPENGTGKSKFCELLSNIFKNNVAPVSNSDLKSEFNVVMADKLLVYCEETMLERKVDTERIKAWSTANEITMNEKNVSQVVIDFFCKFIFCSNNRRMVYLSAQDERFWIIQVPRPAKKDPRLMEKMVEEIPAFVHFLKNRQMATEYEDRMWFNSDLIRTKNFYETVEINEPSEVSNLRQKVTELFEKGGRDLDQIEMPMSNIMQEFFPGKSTMSVKYARELLADYLNVHQRKKNGRAVVTKGKYRRYKQGNQGNEVMDLYEDVYWQGRPYLFNRKDFLNDQLVEFED